MAELDTNADGVLNSSDARFAQLQVWVDANADGSTQAGELKSLAELKITQFGLDVSQGGATSNGNIVGLQSTYQTADGSSHAAADVWFLTSSAIEPDLRGSVSNLVQAIAAFDNLAPAAGNAFRPGQLTADGTGGAAHAAGLVAALSQFDANGQALRSSEALSQAERELRLNGLHEAGMRGILAVPQK